MSMMKTLVSHMLFLRKRGLIVYLAALKMRLFGTHIRTFSYIGSYPLELYSMSITGLPEPP